MADTQVEKSVIKLENMSKEEQNNDQLIEEEEEVPLPITVGCRVQDRKTDECGLVEYHGLVTGSEGVWLGIDWDDPNRGKHDGCHKGTRYFTTRYPSSGSFVRPEKVVRGVNMKKALRDKYQAPPPDCTPYENILQQSTKARFVQFVGMDAVSKKFSALHTLRVVELKDCKVSHAGPAPLTPLLPRLMELSLSGCLLPDWLEVANIVKQLPCLRLLNVSENRLRLPVDPPSLIPSLGHVTHLVMNNMLGYSWQDLLTCASLFPKLKNLQVAYNKLYALGPVPEGSLTSLRMLDVGANPLTDWQQLMHLSMLPCLEELIVNNCQLPYVEFPPVEDGETGKGTIPQTTPHFPHLHTLYIANNPLDNWRTVCQLSRLAKLKSLALSHQLKANDYFPEFTYAIIRGLEMLNRMTVSRKEKRDYELFYLKTFSGDYYDAGGAEDPSQACLSKDFTDKHPTFLQIVEEIGAPYDKREDDKRAKTKSRLRDLKLAVTIECQDGRTLQQSLLPSTKVSRLKMMLKRTLKLANCSKLALSYTPSKTSEAHYRIPLDSEHKELGYYSLSAGDVIHVSW